jgi:hypothetical protein
VVESEGEPEVAPEAVPEVAQEEAPTEGAMIAVLATAAPPPSRGARTPVLSANTWLLTAWRGTKSSSNSANSAAHLSILSVMLGLRRMALIGYEVTTEIL